MDKEILADYLHGVLPENKVKDVEAWLVDRTQDKEVNAFLVTVWSQFPEVRLCEEDRELILNNLNNLIRKQRPEAHRLKHYFNAFQKVAAFLVLPILIFSVYFFIHSKAIKPQILLINTKAGQQKEVLLPDGSHVTLNNQTRLTYVYDPKLNERLVSLTGEACFNVKKATTPFIVNTKEIKVKVLGTIFNVRAYYDDASIRVSLKRGSVWLTGSGNTVSYKMVPGQNAVFNKSSKTLQVRNEDITRNFDWITGTLVFDDEPLTQVAKEIERKYDVQINLASPYLKSEQCRFTATLQNESLNEIMEAINLITPIYYNKEGNKITIKERNNK